MRMAGSLGKPGGNETRFWQPSPKQSCAKVHARPGKRSSTVEVTTLDTWEAAGPSSAPQQGVTGLVIWDNGKEGSWSLVKGTRAPLAGLVEVGKTELNPFRLGT